MEFSEGLLLLGCGKVDKDGASGNDIDGRVGYRLEVISGRLHEGTSLNNPQLSGQFATVIDEILRDVVEDDSPRCTKAIERSKGDEAVTRPDIKEHIVWPQICVIQDPVANGSQMVKLGSFLFGIASMPALQNPARPLVLYRRRH